MSIVLIPLTLKMVTYPYTARCCNVIINSAKSWESHSQSKRHLQKEKKSNNAQNGQRTTSEKACESHVHNIASIKPSISVQNLNNNSSVVAVSSNVQDSAPPKYYPFFCCDNVKLASFACWESHVSGKKHLRWMEDHKSKLVCNDKSLEEPTLLSKRKASDNLPAPDITEAKTLSKYKCGAKIFRSMPQGFKMLQRCDAPASDAKSCHVCRNIYYCSNECQNMDQKSHFLRCCLPLEKCHICNKDMWDESGNSLYSKNGNAHLACGHVIHADCFELYSKNPNVRLPPSGCLAQYNISCPICRYSCSMISCFKNRKGILEDRFC